MAIHLQDHFRLLSKQIWMPCLAFLAVSFSTQAYAQEVGPTLEQRLERLTQDMESQRLDFHIPGMALAVVQGNKLIYSHGFGMADLEEQTPVTPETIFAIGSTSKAFTSALVGMMVDEGKMSWDAPVTEYLPYFSLPIDSDDENAEVIMRDLLAHRTGFTRMGILWAGNQTSREEILRTATLAQPWTGFRKKFFYNNVTFLAAGEATSVAAGIPWDDLLEQRLFKPLQMTSSSSVTAMAQADPRLSLGYSWEEETQDWKALPMRQMDSIAAAGGINSNVLDMAQWVRFQLGHGSFEGNELLSEEQLKATWEKQMDMGPGMGYGMGWMLHEVSGHRVVEHGGNIDGYAAEVALFPDSDLGFVLLTNVTATPLQQTSIMVVAEALLNEWPEESESESFDVAYLDYVGKYSANFGSLKDATLTVEKKNGKLALDVPGQMLFDLNFPDEEGKWYFSLTDEVAVSFVRADDDSVKSLLMYQSGMTFEAPREGVEIEAEIALTELAAYLGKYASTEEDLEFEVKISNQRLSVDVPGEMLYELHVPDEEGRWAFRVIDEVSVSFSTEEDGSVSAMQLLRNGETQANLARIIEEKPVYPSQAELLALRKKAGKLDLGTSRLSGKASMVHSGVHGEITRLVDKGGKTYTKTEFGKFGEMEQVVGDASGWRASTFEPLDDVEGKYLLQLHLMDALTMPGDWSALFDSITVTGTAQRDGREVYSVEMRAGDHPVIDGFIDAETGDLIRFRMTLYMQGMNMTFKTVVYNQDFRLVDGVRVAHKVVSSDDYSGRTILEVESFELDVEVDPKIYVKPE